MSAEYIRCYYGVSFKRGERVVVDGRPGVIVSFPAQYLGVRFDGQKTTSRCHPTWRVEREATKLSDPAVEAAERIRCDGAFLIAVAAAREALAPLRAKHQRRARQHGPDVCTSCRDGYGGHAVWPTGTDRLIYPSGEL